MKRQLKIYEGNGTPMVAQKINRNQACPCGSGKKAKHCCGTGTKYFNSKPDVQAKAQAPSLQNKAMHMKNLHKRMKKASFNLNK